MSSLDGRGGVRVEIDRVGKVFSEDTDQPFEALRPLSIDIKPGEFVSVVGPSGCGKSTLMLMVAGALFARGALQASVTNPGYRYDRLLLATIDPSLAGFTDDQARDKLQAALARIQRIPGVAAVSANSQVPFGDYHMSQPVVRTGHQDSGRREPTYTLITPDYFASVALPILRGRDFTLAEAFSRSATHVAIVDEPLAKRLFAGEDPLGQQISIPVRGPRAARPGAGGV